ncbi:MAG: VCBS repeat-containing protein, partial [Phycisphaerae bacterium]
GKAAACVVADLDGDRLADVLQPFEKGAMVFRGQSAGRFDSPVACGQVGTGAGRARALLGDYDADGLLDVFIASDSGCCIWQNRGRLSFEEAMHRSGEAGYITKPMALDGMTCDINNDGRQDFLVNYADRAPQVFFNRGFRSFGHAHGLDVQENELLAKADKGTGAGVVGDFNRDGAQDMIVVLPDGELWCFFRNTAAGPAPSLRVALPADGAVTGPVTVTGWQGKRCLGAWNVVRGTSEAFLARDVKGPITVRWTLPGGEAQEKNVIVLRPTRFVLPMSESRAGR